MEKRQLHVRRTADQMFPLVERYQSSGQTQKSFCEQEGINMGTFQYWLRKYREQNSSDELPPFQQITVLPESSNSNRQDRYIVIRTPSGMEIKIPMD